MHRIGIAASKMAKGNLFTYNLFVVLLSSLFALFIFFVCGFSILAALFLISLIFRLLLPSDFHTAWVVVAKICLSALSLIVVVWDMLAIAKNIKMTKHKI